MDRKWVGLVHCLPAKDELIMGHGIGCYVQVLAIAKSEKDYCSIVENAIGNIGYILSSIDDILEIDDYYKENNKNTDIAIIWKELSADKPVLFDEMFTYISEDENTFH